MGGATTLGPAPLSSAGGALLKACDFPLFAIGCSEDTTQLLSAFGVECQPILLAAQVECEANAQGQRR